MIIVNCDGSVDVSGGRKSGAEAAYGFIIRKDGVVVATGHGRVPTQWGTTANVGEYFAILSALWKLNELKLLVNQPITIRSDSQLVIYQLTGKNRVQKEHLMKLRDQIRKVDQYGVVLYEWIPRWRNKEADALAGQAWKETP